MTASRDRSTPALSEPSPVVHTEELPWISTGPGKSFRPLRFEPEGWSELMRLEPGAKVACHRHTGEVHAYNLAGRRRLEGSGEIIGPGDYHYEPAGTIDAWRIIGDEPCIVHLHIRGTVEYLDTKGQVVATASSATQFASYRAWCAHPNDRAGRPT
jgi:2,4'-dihydroxyacetophenone dioxygenase